MFIEIVLVSRQILRKSLRHQDRVGDAGHQLWTLGAGGNPANRLGMVPSPPRRKTGGIHNLLRAGLLSPASECANHRDTASVTAVKLLNIFCLPTWKIRRGWHGCFSGPRGSAWKSKRSVRVRITPSRKKVTRIIERAVVAVHERQQKLIRMIGDIC